MTSFVLTTLSLLLIASAPVGYRLAWWDYPVAIKVVTGVGVLLALIAFIAGLIGWFRTGRKSIYTGRFKAGFALLVSGAIIGLMGYQAYLGKTYPYHDVTTDTQTPPSLAVFANADGRLNQVEYNTDWAAWQTVDYPDVQPITVTATLPIVREQVIQLVQTKGWDVLESGSTDTAVYATETSLLYGFKDDVVIRLTPAGDDNVRIDMRSNSRVGESDLGQNAARIMAFLSALEQRL